jgi:hypothetical protein
MGLVATADPVFAAMTEHRLRDAVSDEWHRLYEEANDARKPQTLQDALQAGANVATAASLAAFDALVAVKPTTPAGGRALHSYLLDFGSGTDRRHEAFAGALRNAVKVI